MFLQQKSDLRSLPPTEDAFTQHVLRSIFQLRWWKHANESNPTIPSVTDFGRGVVHNQLVPITNLLPHRPKELEAQSFCKCVSSKCRSNRCSCVKADVPCTIACSCETSIRTEEDQLETESENEDD